ncbi:hypothetical protein Tco_0732880 [Tanacetum coccineum]
MKRVRLRGAWNKKKRVRSNEAGDAASGLEEEEESAWNRMKRVTAARGLEEEEESAARDLEEEESGGDRMKRVRLRGLGKMKKARGDRMKRVKAASDLERRRKGVGDRMKRVRLRGAWKKKEESARRSK